MTLGLRQNISAQTHNNAAAKTIQRLTGLFAPREGAKLWNGSPISYNYATVSEGYNI